MLESKTLVVALLGYRFVSPHLNDRWSNELESMHTAPVPT